MAPIGSEVHPYISYRAFVAPMQPHGVHMGSEEVSCGEGSPQLL